MQKVNIRVKKDRFNEHILEGDHNFLDFLEILDMYQVSIDTLSNFFIVENYEKHVPVYLSALKALKSHSNNVEIIGREIPLRWYEEGFNQGVQTDITPGIMKMEYLIEKINTIFESKIPPFHFDNSYQYSKYPGGPVYSVTGFSDGLWFEYGVQIGKEKQAWNMIMKERELFLNCLNKYIDSKSNKVDASNLYKTIVEINKSLTNGDYLINKQNQNLPVTEQDFLKITNNFDDIPIESIYRHFKSNLVDKKYLTDSQLFEYMKTAFDFKDLPKTRFKFNNAPEKQIIYKVYYQLYKDLAGKPYGKVKFYSALLGDYFEGYNTENVRTNFNKTSFK